MAIDEATATLVGAGIEALGGAVLAGVGGLIGYRLARRQQRQHDRRARRADLYRGPLHELRVSLRMEPSPLSAQWVMDHQLLAEAIYREAVAIAPEDGSVAKPIVTLLFSGDAETSRAELDGAIETLDGHLFRLLS